MHQLAAAVFQKSFRHLFWHLGGLGLIPLGLLDNSPLPLPGSMDALTIVLSAAHKDLWWYYAIMATIGAVLGGYFTYRLGAKGGKEALEKEVSPQRAKKLYRSFERYGFWTVSLGAVCPPPLPIVPFLLAAGALNYPRKKFLTALAFGRAVRYTVVAYLGSLYGRLFFRWLGRYYQPVLYALIALTVIGGLAALYFWGRSRQRSKSFTPVQKR